MTCIMLRVRWPDSSAINWPRMENPNFASRCGDGLAGAHLPDAARCADGGSAQGGGFAKSKLAIQTQGVLAALQHVKAGVDHEQFSSRKLRRAGYIICIGVWPNLTRSDIGEVPMTWRDVAVRRKPPCQFKTFPPSAYSTEPGTKDVL